MILHSNIIGSGDNQIIVLHGLYGSCDSWLQIGKKLAKDFKVHLLDLRNHNQSFYSDAQTYDDMVDDLKSYLDYHQISNCSIIGHSMGGKVAMFFAAKYPNIVNKLVVADISPRSYNSLLEKDLNVDFHLNLISLIKNLDLKRFNSYREISTELNYCNQEVQNVVFKNLKKENGKFVWRINVDAIMNNLGNIMNGLNPDDFIDNKIMTKTLFLKAENSNYIKNSDKKLIAFIFTNSNIVEIHNAGHWLHIEQAEQVYVEIMKFFNHCCPIKNISSLAGLI
jgi:pimeloyl-ACP methyl ester carboxylesterase